MCHVQVRVHLNNSKFQWAHLREQLHLTRFIGICNREVFISNAIRLQIIDDRLQITDYRLQITDYRLQITDQLADLQVRRLPYFQSLPVCMRRTIREVSPWQGLLCRCLHRFRFSRFLVLFSSAERRVGGATKRYLRRSLILSWYFGPPTSSLSKVPCLYCWCSCRMGVGMRDLGSLTAISAGKDRKRCSFLFLLMQ